MTDDAQRSTGPPASSRWPIMGPRAWIFNAGWLGLMVLCLVFMPLWAWLLSIVCKAALAYGSPFIARPRPDE